MSRFVTVLVTLCGLLSVAAAYADDTIAAPGTGGLVLEKADRISMQREDLFISPEEIRVRYEFRNDRGAPFSGHVAFPLPPVSLLYLDHRNTVFNKGRNGGRPVEWIDFRLTVDGARVSPRPRIWATLNGEDITQALTENGIDVPNVELLPDLSPAMDHPDRLRRLEALGAIVDKEPAWETHVAYEWDQTFPPGITVVEHVYKPLLGGAYAPVGDDAGPPDESESRAFDQLGRYCVPRKAIRAAAEAARRGSNPDAMIWFSFASFVLKTARNWDGPIGTFRLTLQSSAAGMQVGACLLGMTLIKADPTQVEAEATDWVADADIDVVFFSDRRPVIPGEN